MIRKKYFRHDDNMTIDVHFQSGSLVRYRTDVTFGWLDLMVSFGGIAGLFLGCSILSGAEIFYYLTILLLVFGKKLKTQIGRYLKFHSNQIKVADSRQNNGKIQKATEKFRVIRLNAQSLNDLDRSLQIKNKARY